MKVAILFCLVILLTGTASAGGLGWPDPVEDATVDSFLSEYPKAKQATNLEYIGYDIYYDSEQDGLFGRLKIVDDFSIVSRKYLEAAAGLFTSHGPLIGFKKIEVQVFSAGKKKKYKRNDFRWIEWTSQDNGVVTLDGTISHALIPGLRVGDHVQVKQEYELKGSFGLGTTTMGDRRFPMRESIVEVRLPQSHQLTWGVSGSTQGLELLIHTQENDGDRVIHRWRLGVDAKEKLPVCNGMYPTVDLTLHLSKVNDTTSGSMVVGESWLAAGEAYAERVKDTYAPSEALKARALALTEGVDSIPEKIDIIYGDVQKRCRYLGLFEGDGGIIPVSAAEVFESGFGDCKGLASLLIGMLRVCGIDAHPVLVLADNSSRVNVEIPCMTQFNHEIVWADDGAGGIFLDGTVDYIPAGFVPPMDMNSPVLVVRPGAVQLMEIPVAAGNPGHGQFNAEGQLDADGFLHLDLAYQATGFMAVRWRSSLTNLSDNDLQEIVDEYLLPQTHPMLSSDFTIEGVGERKGAVVLHASAQSKGPVPLSGDEIFLPRSLWAPKPYVQKRIACGDKVDLRQKPVRGESWSVQLPEGFVLAAADSLVLNSGNVAWTSHAWQEGNILRMERGYRFLSDYATAEEVALMGKLVAKIRKYDQGYYQLVRQ